METTRRRLLFHGLWGAGALGLRALATGIPAPFLLRAGSARADALLGCAAPSSAQCLILSVSGDGDPINANAPGTYEDAAIVHPDPTLAPAMAKTALRLGSTSTAAARAWSTLPQWVLDRTCFFHMATMTTIHPDMPKVLQLMGAMAGKEMLPSLISQQLAGCLGTIQASPVSLLGNTRPEYVTAGGSVLPNLNALALRDVLVHPKGALLDLRALRDAGMDSLHARLKQSGSPAQRAFVDSLAKSRGETRAISDALVTSLESIRDNDVDGQIIGAVTLIAMNVTPVVVIRIPFGGDNHADPDLALESSQTESGVNALAKLLMKLREQKLEDRVTVATLNVFGRTLKQIGTKGRHHWADHHVSVLIGSKIRAGVVGGVAPGASQDYTALPIDSGSGQGSTSGDVPVNETLSAFGKTLGAAVGVSKDALEANIRGGKVLGAALA